MKSLRWALIGSLMTYLSFGLVACSDDKDDPKPDEKPDPTDVDSGAPEKKPDAGKTPGEMDAGETPDKMDPDASPVAMTDAGPVEMDSGKVVPGGPTEAEYLAMLKAHPSVTCTATKVCTIASGEVTEDLTLYDFPDVIVQLATDGKYVFIGDDTNETILTLMPGVTLYGSGKTALIIQRGSKIMAEGTKEKPIVLTSSATIGMRKTGDWGGLVINGRATTNKGSDVGGEANSGTFGGTDDKDSSGVLKYVRVEFAGNKVDLENELNGIAFQGVGSGTMVDYVQVHYNADDGIEFFGGTVSVKHVVLTGIGDDSLDWTDGWTGTAQYVVAEQGAEGDNGIEGDNQRADSAAAPISSPVLGNLTLIGGATSGEGVQLRAGTHGELWNSVVTGFADGCFTVETAPSIANVKVMNSVLACGASALVFGHMVDDDKDPLTAPVPGNVMDSQGVFDADASNTVVDGIADLKLDGWLPKAGSPLLGASAPSAKLEKTDYIGAFDAGEDWTKGWIQTESK